MNKAVAADVRFLAPGGISRRVRQSGTKTHAFLHEATPMSHYLHVPFSRLLRALKAGACLAAFALPVHAQSTASIALTALRPVEITWGDFISFRADVTLAAPCASPPAGPATVQLRVSGMPTQQVPTSITMTCSAGVYSGQATLGLFSNVGFGTYAAIAEFNWSSNSASSPAIIVRVNPEFSFVIPGGQGVLKAGITDSVDYGCPVRAATLHDRTSLPVPVPPPNMHFPYAHVRFTASNCTHFNVSFPALQFALIEFPDAIAPDAEMWIHDTLMDGTSAAWKPLAATFNGRQASFRLSGRQNSVNATVALAVPQPISSDFALQDLWWGSADGAGWGLNIAKNANRLFSTLFIYDDAGKPQWVVMPAGTWDPIHQVYYGDLFIPTGSSYASYNSERFDMGVPVGKGSLSFTTEDDGNFDYIVRGTAGGQRIVRYKFAPLDKTTPLYGGMWWGGAGQDGWGVSIQQQAQTLFATWYTYGADGKVTWFYMPGGSWTSSTTYTGTLYRTTAGPWLGVNYNAANLKVITVGTLKLDFSSPNAATMTSTVDGVTLTRPIARFGF